MAVRRSGDPLTAPGARQLPEAPSRPNRRGAAAVTPEWHSDVCIVLCHVQLQWCGIVGASSPRPLLLLPVHSLWTTNPLRNYYLAGGSWQLAEAGRSPGSAPLSDATDAERTLTGPRKNGKAIATD